jgi:hypothetical protein
MAATAEERVRLSTLPAFRVKVEGCLLQVANEKGDPAAAKLSSAANDKNLAMVEKVFQRSESWAEFFAKGAAGWNPTSPANDIADAYSTAYAAAVGDETVKNTAGVNAVSETIVLAYLRGAWDVFAGIRPSDRA